MLLLLLLLLLHHPFCPTHPAPRLSRRHACPLTYLAHPLILAHPPMPHPCPLLSLSPGGCSNAGTNAYRTGPLALQETEDIIAIVESNVIGVMLGGWAGWRGGGGGGWGRGRGFGLGRGGTEGPSALRAICCLLPAANRLLPPTWLPAACAGCKEAIRVMRGQPSGGHIFNMDGAGADGGATPRFAAYGATKRGLAQLGKSLQVGLSCAVLCCAPQLGKSLQVGLCRAVCPGWRPSSGVPAVPVASTPAAHHLPPPNTVSACHRHRERRSPPCLHPTVRVGVPAGAERM